jgi:hypothetical protein
MGRVTAETPPNTGGVFYARTASAGKSCAFDMRTISSAQFFLWNWRVQPISLKTAEERREIVRQLEGAVSAWRQLPDFDPAATWPAFSACRSRNADIYLLN